MAKIKNLPKHEQHKGSGHRKRLRNRFLQSGLKGFLDYEIVELLLTLGTPMKDCKQMAKEVIREFGGLRGALDASLDELQKINGIGPSNAFGIKLFQAMSERLAKERVLKKIKFYSPKVVADYLIKFIGREKKENFVVLSLNEQNNLIESTSVSVGSLNSSIVHPREVFKEAIQNSAARIIISHNHPSGDTEPSPEDKLITKRLCKTGKSLSIEVLDHIIVSNIDYYSFKERNIL